MVVVLDGQPFLKCSCFVPISTSGFLFSIGLHRSFSRLVVYRGSLQRAFAAALWSQRSCLKCIENYVERVRYGWLEEILHQLRLVVYPTIEIQFYTSQVVQDFFHQQYGCHFVRITDYITSFQWICLKKILFCYHIVATSYGDACLTDTPWEPLHQGSPTSMSWWCRRNVAAPCAQAMKMAWMGQCPLACRYSWSTVPWRQLGSWQDVSENSGVFSPNHPLKARVSHYKPSILEYHYFWKHPYRAWTFVISFDDDLYDGQEYLRY